MTARKYSLVVFSFLVGYLATLPSPASAATLSGTVIDSNGPIAGIRVALSRVICTGYGYTGHECAFASTSTLTATDGTYSFADFFHEDPVGEYTVAAPSLLGTLYVSQSEVVQIIEEGQSIQVDFELELASTISGTIRKADGGVLTADEAEHIEVQIHPAEGGISLHYFASLNLDGSYLIPGLPSGRSYSVSARGDGTVNYIQEWSTGAISVPDELELTGSIEIVSPGSQINGVNFQLDSGATVQGTVYHAAEVASADFKVFLKGSSADNACAATINTITDQYTVDVREDGSYTVTGLGAGNYYAEAYYPLQYSNKEWLTGINTDSSSDCLLAEKLTVTSEV